jgi:hypothetical protein
MKAQDGSESEGEERPEIPISPVHQAKLSKRFEKLE